MPSRLFADGTLQLYIICTKCIFRKINAVICTSTSRHTHPATYIKMYNVKLQYADDTD